MGLRELFEAVADFFERERIDYAVIGAFALYAFGYVRATRDIDFAIRQEDQQKAIDFLEGLGFETTHRSHAFSNHLHAVGSVRIDLMYLEGITADEVFAHIERKALLKGKAYAVVAPEHLIAMKLFAASHERSRRLKDLADIREVVKRADVDAETVRKLFAKFGMEDEYDDTIL